MACPYSSIKKWNSFFFSNSDAICLSSKNSKFDKIQKFAFVKKEKQNMCSSDNYLQCPYFIDSKEHLVSCIKCGSEVPVGKCCSDCGNELKY